MQDSISHYFDGDTAAVTARTGGASAHDHDHGHGHDHSHGHLDHGGHGHTHNAAVFSVSLEHWGAMDEGRLEQWLGGLIQAQHADIYRLKGVVAVAGAGGAGAGAGGGESPGGGGGGDAAGERKLVVQSVHSMFQGDWQGHFAAGEPARSRIVLIGQNLDREALQRDFEACCV